MLRVPWRLPSPSSATATWASLWVSTPRVIVAASVGMHRVTFSSPRSPDEHRAFMFTRAEMRRTPLRWVFYRKAQASIKSRPSRSGGGASDLIDESPARHSCRPVKIGLAEAHLHGFGVARQGPWITWVNRGKRARTRAGVCSEGSPYHLHQSRYTRVRQQRARTEEHYTCHPQHQEYNLHW